MQLFFVIILATPLLSAPSLLLFQRPSIDVRNIPLGCVFAQKMQIRS